MTLVLSKCREMSVMSLIFANDVDFAKPRVEEGWDIVAVGTDAGWFGKAAAATRRDAGGNADCRPASTLRLTLDRACARMALRGMRGLHMRSLF